MISAILRKASFLAAAGLIEYALQLVLPVILVRYLTKSEFGDYRLTWLVAETGLILFPLFMPQSLFYFLPRAAAGSRSKLVGNVFVSLLVIGWFSALLLLVLMPILPKTIADLQRYSPFVQIFVGAWILGSILDVLPIADGKAGWQACAVIVFAILRISTLAVAAVVLGDFGSILVIMCGLAMLKIGMAVLYALFAAQEPGLGFDGQLLRVQLRYSVPFAIAQGFFALRVHADQWVVAANFPSNVFALISIASVVFGVGTLIRQPLNTALVPNISFLLGQGNIDDASSLISKGYLLLGLVLPPILGLLILTADDLVELVYTSEYLGAVPLMRIYLLGQMATVFAAGHLLGVFGYGRESAITGAISLLLSIVSSILGVKLFGLAGAVAGSTISLVVWEWWAINKVAKGLGTSVFTLMRLNDIWKVWLVAAIGLLFSYIVCSWLNLPIVLQLVAKSSIFVATVLLGLVLTNLGQSMISLLRPLRASPAAHSLGGRTHTM
jgi:O-antigen/teichoic acid export membrane protein